MSSASRPLTWLLGVLLTAGLGFGAVELAGTPLDSCPQGYHGPCPPSGDCYEVCFPLFPENGGAGFCDESVNCCMCAER